VIREALNQYQKNLIDGIPGKILDSLGLPGLRESINHIHFPPRGSSIELLNRFNTKFHQRLTFDRFFGLMLGIAFRKKTRDSRSGPVLLIPKDLIDRTRECFPFTLTGDQNSVIQEIFRDLNSEKPMNRLLQGDVGCGKTVVAAAASYATTLNNWQVAIMAPTQVLAKQHFLYFSGLSKKMGFRPVLLTGAIKNAERQEAYEKVKNAWYNLIIGTHALIQESLYFSRLGLVIIDEQHRFGVTQRAMLDRKGENPHLLIMSATPIPRTLSMTVYADLDISSIKEYPEGHQAVKTFIVDKNQKRKVYNTINERMAAGEQAIVICPVIEGSEDLNLKNALQMHEKLVKLFSPRFHVGLIHGRLSSDEKDRVMEQFMNSRIDLLVGTTAIEVGVHAADATVMVIEHPERFGLSQLHQLRGRVGRGEKQGLCLLMASGGLQEDAVARLNILVQSHDGFEIARKDLEIRGQGKLTGTVQAGTGELDISEIFREPELLKGAKKEAEKILASDPDLSLPENRILRQMVKTTHTGPTDF
jgi:ATP-dependent DNA helicase RecG